MSHKLSCPLTEIYRIVIPPSQGFEAKDHERILLVILT